MMNSKYKPQKLFVIAIGVVQILVGVIAAYYGPLEIYVFYLFSHGGPFHYDGFGFGSLWFALLVLQNLVYYLVAGLLLPLGIGHIKRRRWALTLSRLYLWMWLATSGWLIINLITLIPFILNLGLNQNIIIIRLAIVGIFWVMGFCILPVGLLRFYQNKTVQLAFEDGNPQLYWIEQYPFPLLVLLFLYFFYIIILHLALFFQAMMPFFGTLLWGRSAAYIISLCILFLLGLMYGVFKLKLWAWRGSFVYFCVLTISVLMTFTKYSVVDTINKMGLPEFEIEFLDRVVIWQGLNLFTLLGIPLLATVGWIVYSRRYFQSPRAS